MKISLVSKTIIVIEIFALALLIICFIGFNKNKEGFNTNPENGVSYTETQGVCRTFDINDPPELTQYPNNRIIEYDNTPEDINKCRDLCDVNENCLGYSKNSINRKCHLYGTNFNKKTDIEGVGGATSIDRGLADSPENMLFNCYKKEGLPEKQSVMLRNRQILNQNQNWINEFGDFIDDKITNQNKLIKTNSQNIYKTMDNMVRNLVMDTQGQANIYTNELNETCCSSNN